MKGERFCSSARVSNEVLHVVEMPSLGISLRYQSGINQKFAFLAIAVGFFANLTTPRINIYRELY